MRYVPHTVHSIVIGSAFAMGCTAAAQEVVLGYIPGSLEYPYNVATAEGFESEATELGAKTIILDPRGTVEKQANGVDDLLAQGVQGIAVLPLDGVIARSWVDKVNEMDIPFVAAATNVGDPDQVQLPEFVYAGLSAFVGSDNVQLGERAGEIAVKLLPTDRTATIAIVEGAPGYPQVNQRTAGFVKALDAAGVEYEIVASQPTDWTPETGEQVCQNVLAAHPDIDLIFSQADDMALGCARAIAGAGAQIRLVATGGGSTLGIQAIAAGELDGSVCDRPRELGRLAAKALYDAVVNEDTPKGRNIGYDTPAITKDSIGDCPETW